ncbi:nuclear transport factor 2 family protein [Pseudomonas lini]
MAAAPSPGEKDVAAAVDHLTQAMLNKNVLQLQALTAENLTYGHSSGKKSRVRKNSLPTSKTGKSAFKTLEMQNQTITVSGDVALVRHHFFRRRPSRAPRSFPRKSRTSRSGKKTERQMATGRTTSVPFLNSAWQGSQ